MRIEIVTHAWQYERLLTYHLSAIALHPPSPDVQVLVTVFHAEGDADQPTRRVLEWFAADRMPPNVTLRPWPLTPNRLFRRAIGRNLAAEATEADWVWFADVDYLARDGCLDALAATTAAGPLLYPNTTWASRSHQLGDKAIERVIGLGMYSIHPRDFEPRTNKRAIGGLQIVRGDVAREKGYCRNTRWQRPEKRWRRTFEDQAYRKILGTRGQAIMLPNLYRIRHSKRGRTDVGVRL